MQLIFSGFCLNPFRPGLAQRIQTAATRAMIANMIDQSRKSRTMKDMKDSMAKLGAASQVPGRQRTGRFGCGASGGIWEQVLICSCGSLLFPLRERPLA